MSWQERILDLASRNGGKVTPNAVVEDACDPTSPLHKLFEWNDTIAASRYRVEQARTLISSVRVQLETIVIGDGGSKPEMIQAFVRDLAVDTREQGYVRVDRLRDDEARATLAWELSRAEAGLRRVQRIAEAMGLGGDLSEMMEVVTSMREKLAS